MKTVLKGKLDLSADFTVARLHSDVTVDAGPSTRRSRPRRLRVETLAARRLSLKEKLSLVGSYWYEHYDAQDWRSTASSRRRFRICWLSASSRRATACTSSAWRCAITSRCHLNTQAILELSQDRPGPF